MRTALLTVVATLATVSAFGACGGTANNGAQGWGGGGNSGGGGTNSGTNSAASGSGGGGTSSGGAGSNAGAGSGSGASAAAACGQCATNSDCQNSCGDGGLYCCYVATPGSMGTCYSWTSASCPASSSGASTSGGNGGGSNSSSGFGGSSGFSFGGSSGFAGFGGSSGFAGFGGFGGSSGFGGFGGSSGFAGFGGSSGAGGFGGSSSSGSGSSGAGSSSSSGAAGSGGGAGSSSSGAAGSSSGGMATGGSSPTMIPAVSGTCPTFKNGSTVTVTAGGGSIQAQIWMGSSSMQGGPLILYWHGTGSSPSAEVPIAFDTTALANAGGMIAGFVSSSRTGTTTGNTGDAVWYESDAAFADQVVACAIQQLNISPRRIHTAGYSAGGLQTVYMWYGRSGYIASVISYSGGDATINKAQSQDPTNIPAAIAAHGAMGSDALILDFASASATWESEIKADKGFSIDCNDGGNHLAFFSTRAPGLKPVALQFFLDHPFKAPNTYTTLPSGFPSYCHID